MERIVRMYCAATVWPAHSVEPPVPARRHSRRFVSTLANLTLGLLNVCPSSTRNQVAKATTFPGTGLPSSWEKEPEEFGRLLLSLFAEQEY